MAVLSVGSELVSSHANQLSIRMARYGRWENEVSSVACRATGPSNYRKHLKADEARIAEGIPTDGFDPEAVTH